MNDKNKPIKPIGLNNIKELNNTKPEKRSMPIPTPPKKARIKK